MRCPECLGEHVEVREFDFGVCPETGYHDAGERFHCLDCGATGDADDLVTKVGNDSDTCSAATAGVEVVASAVVGSLVSRWLTGVPNACWTLPS